MPTANAKKAMIKARIDADVIAQFDAMAQGRGGRSAVVRMLIEGWIKEQGSVGLVPAREELNTRRVQISLSESEIAVIDYSAQQRSVNRAGWVKALVRRHLGLKGSKEDGLVTALAPIRSQLIRIGRNINQVMKAANVILVSGKGDLIADELAHIAQMRSDLSEQIAAIRSAMQGDYSYWQVPD